MLYRSAARDTRSRRGAQAALALAVAALIASTPLRAQELLTNGDFETGTFAAWTVASAGSGDVFLSTPGADTPGVAPGFVTFPTPPNPYGGSFYAVTASDGPGNHALIQDFSVAGGATAVILVFSMFVNDHSGVGPIVDPSGLDYTTGGTFAHNQHARVDILRAGAPDFSTSAADDLANYYMTVDPLYDGNGQRMPSVYYIYSQDISDVVGGGGTFRLRFAEVNNLGSINLGVDNVSIVATYRGANGVPEPGSLPMLLGCLGGAGFLARRRRR